MFLLKEWYVVRCFHSKNDEGLQPLWSKLHFINTGRSRTTGNIKRKYINAIVMSEWVNIRYPVINVLTHVHIHIQIVYASKRFLVCCFCFGFFPKKDFFQQRNDKVGSRQNGQIDPSPCSGCEIQLHSLKITEEATQRGLWEAVRRM